MVSHALSGATVPVHCKCGWTGFRTPRSIKRWTCPACDGEVKRWRKLESAETVRQKLMGNVELLPMPAGDIVKTYGGPPHQYDLEDEIAERNAPVPRLPVPYYLRTFTGEVQIFRIPAHCRRRR